MLGADDENEAQVLGLAQDRLRLHNARESERRRKGLETDLSRFLAGKKIED